MEVDFDLATPADDAGIQALLQANPVPGRISLSFERAPSYFPGCYTHGPFWQVLVARAPAGVVGVACRAVRPLFVDGQELAVGYLSQLRVDEVHRGRWLVSRGTAFLRELHEDGRAPFYLATITEENAVARGILVERPRRHYPAYREVCRVWTLSLAVRRPRPVPAAPAVRRATAADLPEIVAFLREHGARRQFFPAYTVADFQGPVTAGFQVEDFLLARRPDGSLAGVIGLWDQSACKQTVVQGYSGALRWARPLVSAGFRLMGGQPLPAPGEEIRYAYGSFCCIASDDPECFAALLAHLYNLAAERRYAYLMLGFAEGDPLLPVARRYPHITYHSRLYTVSWENGGSLHDHRTPYVEIAAL